MKQGQTTKIANKIVIAISHPEKPLHKVKKLLKHSDFRENNAPYNLWPITSNGMSYFQMRIVSSTVYTKLYHKIIVYFFMLRYQKTIQILCKLQKASHLQDPSAIVKVLRFGEKASK